MIAGIIIILLILTPSVIAQVNTEKMRMGLSESGFSGDINFSYSVNMGNSELTKIGLAPNFVFRSGKNQLFMLNDLDRVYDEEGSIINKAFTHLRYNYEFTDKFILEMFVQAQYNRSTNLDHRYLAGTGIRIIPIEQESFLMAVGLTGMHEDEELEGGESTRIIRGSSYLYLKFLKEELITIVNTVYFQPNFEDTDDYRILNQAEISAWIFKNLAVTTSLNYSHDSQPPEGIKHYDLEIQNGIKFRFDI